MEIMLHSPRGIRHVINRACSRWLSSGDGDTYALKGPHKAESLRTGHPSFGLGIYLSGKINAC